MLFLEGVVTNWILLTTVMKCRQGRLMTEGIVRKFLLEMLKSKTTPVLCKGNAQSLTLCCR